MLTVVRISSFLGMRKIKVLILEDDPQVRKIFINAAQELEMDSLALGTFEDALNAIEEGYRPEILLLDNQLPDGLGEDFFELSRSFKSQPLTIMFTAYPEIANVVRLTQKGLFHYNRKPFSVLELEKILLKAKSLIMSGSAHIVLDGMVAESPITQKIVKAIQMAGPYRNSVVLLTGETGTGKEACARLLHKFTYLKEAGEPFITLNCAAVPTELVEAELFGAEKGAYTSSVKDRKGLIESANGGTLFLDEIGEMPISLQAKLLRFLENREYRRLGSDLNSRFSGRLIVATNRNLREEVKAGKFREDLFYRLDVLNIHLPPLRSRPLDIIPLALLFLENICQEMGRPTPEIAETDLHALEKELLPGNAREIRNIIERALLSTPVELKFLALGLSHKPEVLTTSPADISSTVSWIEFLPISSPEGGRMAYVERELVAYAMTLYRGNISKAAKWLGISRQQVYRKLAAVNLDTTELKSPEV